MRPTTRHGDAFSREPGRPRGRGRKSEKALRQAIARRKLEERREEEWLREQIYDVLSGDDGC